MICELSCIVPLITIFSLIFLPTFPMWRVAGTAALVGIEIPHGQQKSQMVLLAPLQDGTKQGRRCNHSTRSLGDFLAAFPWVYPAGLASSLIPGAFWTDDRNNVTGISRFGEAVRPSGLCVFHSCTLCCEVSRREFFGDVGERVHYGVIAPMTFKCGGNGVGGAFLYFFYSAFLYFFIVHFYI